MYVFYTYRRKLSIQCFVGTRECGTFTLVTVHAAVRELRLKLNLSQQAFAGRLGISISAVQNYEKNRVPNLQQLGFLYMLAREEREYEIAQIFRAAIDTASKVKVELMASWWKRYEDLRISTEREWVFMACAKRISSESRYASLFEPFVKAIGPVMSDMIEDGTLVSEDVLQAIAVHAAYLRDKLTDNSRGGNNERHSNKAPAKKRRS